MGDFTFDFTHFSVVDYEMPLFVFLFTTNDNVTVNFRAELFAFCLCWSGGYWAHLFSVAICDGFL